MSKVHRYEGDGFAVLYDAKRCIHAAECVRGLPRVFDPRRRPWVETAHTSGSEIAEVVYRCPTGALTLDPGEGIGAERAPQENVVTVRRDGPLYLRGRIELEAVLRGDRVEEVRASTLQETRVALCRCGDSQNKPFCDNSHLEKGFRDEGGVGESRLAPAGEDRSGPLAISTAPNGPLLLTGPFTLTGAEGGEPVSGGKAALCRCGASANKPYCDGSHVAVGFEAD